MSDHCSVEITMRRADLSRFAVFVEAGPGQRWWDCDDEVSGLPELTTLRIYECNHGWTDQRQAAAAAGICFYGSHGDGGEYGACAFAAIDGEQIEVPINSDGYMYIAVDDDLNPLDDIEHLRAYVTKLKAVKTRFGIKEVRNDDGNQETDPGADQPAGPAQVPVGVRTE